MAFYTREQIDYAKNLSLVDYCFSKYGLIKKGATYSLKTDPSVVIFPEKNAFYDFGKTQLGGDILDFMIKYEGKNFQEAMIILIGDVNIDKKITSSYKSVEYIPPKEENKGLLCLPSKNIDNVLLYKYLTEVRGISPEVVDYCISNNLIYQNDKGGVVFLGKDNDGEVKFACIRSTNINSSFRQDVLASRKEYGFNIKGVSKRVLVFEAPIDLLSHMSLLELQGRPFLMDSYVSLGGLSDKSLNRFLKDNPEINEIALFLDNDRAGEKTSKDIYKKYINDYTVHIFSPKKEKDLNEVLLQYKKEVKENPNVKAIEYIKSLEPPFIPKKLFYNNLLDEYLGILFFSDDSIDAPEKQTKFSKRKYLAVDEDDNLVLDVKDDLGNSVGAFYYDVRTNKFLPDPLSEKKYVLFKPLENDYLEKSLIITDCLVLASHFMDFNYVLFLDDIKKIEEVKKSLNFLKFPEELVIYTSFSSINPDDKTYKEYMSLQEKYPNLEISIEKISYPLLAYGRLHQKIKEIAKEKNKIEKSKKLNLRG